MLCIDVHNEKADEKHSRCAQTIPVPLKKSAALCGRLIEIRCKAKIVTSRAWLFRARRLMLGMHSLI